MCLRMRMRVRMRVHIHISRWVLTCDMNIRNTYLKKCGSGASAPLSTGAFRLGRWRHRVEAMTSRERTCSENVQCQQRGGVVANWRLRSELWLLCL